MNQRLLSFAAVPALLAACGPLEGSYEVTWKGTVHDQASEGSMTVPLREASQWLNEDATVGQLNCPNNDCSLSGVDPQQVPAMITSNMGQPGPLDDEASFPPVRVQLFNLYHVPLVGKGAAQAHFQVGGSLTEGVVDITRIHLTGSTDDPIVVEGAFDQHAAGQNPVTGGNSDVDASGSFSVVVSCRDNAPTRGRFMCSPQNPTDAENEQANFIGESQVIAPAFPPSLSPVPEVCPAGIWSAVVAGNATFDGSSLDMGAQRLSCSAHFCQASFSVDADGCGWDVTAIADVGTASITNPNATGTPRNTQVFVSAVAKDGCERAVTFCQATP